tara:strand:- start:2001 stop:4337 length:2337 start_codon:yes stop_codon:yes gene_type:complete
MGKHNRVVNIESKNVLAKLMATENIHVEHKKVSTASFDVKNRRLILPIWKDMDHTMYEGLIGHEVGHALYTPYEEWAEFAKKNSHLKAYANILEDARIERKMKIKYPGMKKTFFEMYDALARQDFFGTHGRDLGEYGFADRLNLSFKIGALAEVPFSEEEEEFRGRVLKAETFEDILELSRELGKMAKEEAETNMEDMEMSDSGDETESNEDEDVEPSGSAPFPMPTPPESEENEEEEDSGARADSDEEKEEGNNEGNCKSDESDGEGEKKESETGDEGDEKSDEPNHSASGNCDAEMTDPEENDDLPEAETQKAWEEAMEEMNDAEAKEPIYLDLPKINPYKSVVPWKDIFEQLNEHWSKNENFSTYRFHWEEAGADKWKKEEENAFRTWKKDTTQIVNYMVKEFEMKQAATEYRRTSISKTGVLDMNKLHKYRTDEDIFRRVASVKDGRNHALLMFIDWSGSMHGKMEATVKQTLTLVMFARKVGIPFRVYSFSNSGGILDKIGKDTYYSRAENSAVDHLVPGKLGMHEYFSEKMSSREFNIQLKNMAFLGKSVDYSGLSHPAGHGTCSTPLNESILAATEMVGDFKKETGAEKVNAIFLTDGGADYCSDYWDSEKQEKKDVYSYRQYGSDHRKYLVIRDNVTKRLVHTDGTRAKLTGSLLRNLANRHNINVIGFHITDSSKINRQIQYEASYSEHAELRSFAKKHGYVPMKESGYATYFLVNDKQLDKEANFNTDGVSNDAGVVAKGKLRTQFRKFTSARKVNKMMLNEFVALVA